MANQPKITAFSFDASSVDPSSPNEPIAKDWYPTIVYDSDVVPTGGNGGATDNRMARLSFKIIDGPSKGRTCRDRFNYIHENEQTQDIAQKQLAAIQHAIGVLKPSDTRELQDKPFLMLWDIEAANTGRDGKEYPARNKFGGAKRIEGAVNAPTTTPSFAPPGNAPAAAAAPAKRPGRPPKNPAAAPAAAPAKPAAPVAERMFFIGLDGPAYVNSFPESKIVEFLGKGLPPATALCMEGDEAWKTAAEYNVGAKKPEPAPAATPVKVNNPDTPWMNE